MIIRMRPGSIPHIPQPSKGESLCFVYYDSEHDYIFLYESNCKDPFLFDSLRRYDAVSKYHLLHSWSE